MFRAFVLTGLVLLGIAYYYLFGPGPSPSEIGELPWWRPRGWALRWESLAALKELREADGWARLVPVLVFAVPVVVLWSGLLRMYRGAVARTVLTTIAFTAIVFVYYGYLAEGIWRFFEWRAPAATLSFFALLSTVLFSPSLLRRALRLSAGPRAAVLAAFFCVIYLLSTEITGTNPTLAANLSPWPVVTLFGLLLLGYVLSAWHLAAGLGLWVWSRLSGAGGVVAGIVVAAIAGGLLSFWVFESGGGRGAVFFAVVTAIYAMVAGLRAKEPGAEGLARVAAGALITASIFLSNQAAVTAQERARDETAAQVVEALGAYHAAHGVYPDKLENLVPDQLGAIPRPRMGWIEHSNEEFTYSNFGDSFALEFSSVLWVQCAYSPPYAYEDDEYADDEPEFEASMPDVAAEPEGLAEAWSCESAPPKIW